MLQNPIGFEDDVRTGVKPDSKLRLEVAQSEREIILACRDQHCAVGAGGEVTRGVGPLPRSGFLRIGSNLPCSWLLILTTVHGYSDRAAMRPQMSGVLPTPLLLPPTTMIAIA